MHRFTIVSVCFPTLLPGLLNNEMIMSQVTISTGLIEVRVSSTTG